MIALSGKITSYDERGRMVIEAEFKDTERFMRCKFKEATVYLNDSRNITNDQRKKIYAMIAEVAEWAGDLPEIQKKILKIDFKLKRIEHAAKEISFKDCAVELASDFIDYLVDFILANGVPLKQPLVALCDDVKKYVYSCLKYKACSICGIKGELHHVDVVGMGRDRREIPNEGLRAVCLCRNHHDEAHKTGNIEFLKRYHLEPVKLDKELCKNYKIKL